MSAFDFVMSLSLEFAIADQTEHLVARHTALAFFDLERFILRLTPSP